MPFENIVCKEENAGIKNFSVSHNVLYKNNYVTFTL